MEDDYEKALEHSISEYFFYSNKWDRQFVSQLTPRFLRVDKKQKKRATGLEHFFLRGQPPLSSPVWDIYIGIFSPTPTFITVYVRYRFCREGEKKVQARKKR